MGARECQRQAQLAPGSHKSSSCFQWNTHNMTTLHRISHTSNSLQAQHTKQTELDMGLGM